MTNSDCWASGNWGCRGRNGRSKLQRRNTDLSRLARETWDEVALAAPDREYETMRLIASGKTLSEIAAEMSLSVKTVSVYRARLLQKMQLKNNSELTHYALKNQLVD